MSWENKFLNLRLEIKITSFLHCTKRLYLFLFLSFKCSGPPMTIRFLSEICLYCRFSMWIITFIHLNCVSHREVGNLLGAIAVSCPTIPGTNWGPSLLVQRKGKKSVWALMPYSVLVYFLKDWCPQPIQKHKETQILSLDSLKRLEIYNQWLLYKWKFVFLNSGK